MLFGISLQNRPIPVLIFWASTSSTMCMLCVNTLLKVVSYYLNVLSMSMMGFQKSSDRGWVDGVNYIQVVLDFCNFFLTLQSP